MDVKRYTSEVMWAIFARYGPGGGGGKFPADYKARIAAYHEAGLTHLHAAKRLASELGWDDFGPMPEDN